MAVIVGVDGSEHARAALVWAIEEARLRDDTLVAAYVYTSPSLLYPAEVIPTASAERLGERTRKAARDELDGILSTVRQASADVRIVAKTIEDPQPAYALTDLATEDDLLVVGSRGRGGFRGLLLGSVSQQCLQHAPCPVTVVPAALAQQG